MSLIKFFFVLKINAKFKKDKANAWGYGIRLKKKPIDKTIIKNI